MFAQLADVDASDPEVPGVLIALRALAAFELGQREQAEV